MIYIECPKNVFDPEVRAIVPNGAINVFMAGGITDCPNWQQEYRELLKDESDQLVLLNPRRGNFNVREDGIAEQQIIWEHRHLVLSNVFSFWFPCDTLCPITLFELGKISAGRPGPLFVGTHPDYKRKVDVVVQMQLIRTDVQVVHSIEELADQVRQYVRNPSAYNATRQIY